MDNNGPGRVLGAVGLSELEERVYDVMLAHHGGSVTDISAAVGCSERRTRELLGSLQDKGLVSRSGTRWTRYVPAPPDAALEILILRRQEELEKARLCVAELAERFHSGASQGSSKDIVEMVPAGEAVQHRESQLLSGAREEILGFAMPPFKAFDEAYTKWKLGILGRGVRGRVVYSLEAMEAPGIVELIHALSPAGEQARTFVELPMKLIVVDRRAALLPLTLADQTTSTEWLVVRESSLLDALVKLFEATWAQAAPFPGPPTHTSEDEEELPISTEEQRLLYLLAAGMKDGAIARQMGITARTVERRLARIMDELGTRTRFQTAVEACRRGWLGQEPET